VVFKVRDLLPASWPMEVKVKAAEDPDGEANTTPQPTWEEVLHQVSPEAQLDAYVLDNLRASLARIKPARAEARKLIGMTRGRFPIQWSEDVFLTKINSDD